MFIIVGFLIAYNLNFARIKYEGGDWYNDPSALKNLAMELNNRTTMKANPEEIIVSLMDKAIFDYPFLFLTGHGNIKLSNLEIENLKTYLINGGFLYVDDDYGLDSTFRQEIQKVFPSLEFEELAYSHPVYHSFYDFTFLPKIHKHNGKTPKCYGMFYQGKLVILYTYETNISDGWADESVHKDPEIKREEAFKFGINIVVYAMTQ
ncbi:MAG: DUF4159 domain-containing protein [bacterium]|nr:DUF4159 domain-containing protein [bacterium]